jgi:hydroxymethylglutaryl-CoA lyase
MTAVQIVEVGARDGLQNEPELIATGDKLGLIVRMVDAGVRRI